MKTIHFAAALGFLATLAAAPATAADSLVRYDGAIGSQPLRAGPAANNVFTVTPGGAPWVIRTFRADVKTDGSISARGEGLLLGGTNNVGARGGTRFVVASLFCRDAAGGPIGPFNSAPADLDVNGDFQIRGPLTNSVGAPPPVLCGDELDNRPVLLIRRSAATGVVDADPWFAAGILKD